MFIPLAVAGHAYYPILSNSVQRGWQHVAAAAFQAVRPQHDAKNLRVCSISLSPHSRAKADTAHGPNRTHATDPASAARKDECYTADC